MRMPWSIPALFIRREIVACCFCSSARLPASIPL
jgi:hypothetical protein